MMKHLKHPHYQQMKLTSFCVALLLLAFGISLSSPTNAADITIISGQTETTNQSSTTNGDTISILSGGTVATTAFATPALQAFNSNVTLNNAGTITTTGENSQGMEAIGSGSTGAIIINSGSISVTGSGSSGIQSKFSNNTTITNNGSISATGTASNAINISSNNNIVNLNSGSNLIGDILIGPGSKDNIVTLEGNTNLTGNILINAFDSSNSLFIKDDAIINGNINTKGAITFEQSAQNGSYAGIISSTTRVTKTGANTLTLSGANTYSGGTVVSGGTLQGTTSSLQGNIINNANVTFDQTTTGTFSGGMSGTGSLTKSNSGTVILSGANTYSGGTTVSGGILQGTTSSLQGNIINNANVTFDQTTTGTFSDVISGTGSLTKSNTGTVILSGANTYSGGTTVSGGILQGTTSSLQGNITNNANVTFDQSTTGTFSDVISGSGSLTKNGTGTLTLTGSNTYTGTTTIEDGILFIGNGSATGSITGNVINNSQLTFTRSDTSTYAGDISGTGSVAKQSAGTLTLTGNATHTGGTTIVGGTLQIGDGGTTGSITGDITNNTALIFNRSDALTYADVISGSGSFTQAGNGSTNLTGTNTYSGTTTVNAGTLYINGSNSASTTTVNNGGTLGGTGTVGSVIISSGGIFAPGNSIGTLDVAGNVDFSGGGIYQVEVNAAGNSDLINATGTATLTGGVVEILPEAGAYNFTTNYTILTAAGGLLGTFDNSTIDNNFAFLTPTLSYDSNNVFLNLTRNDVSFSGVAATFNQTAVANTLEALALSNPVAVTEIQNNLLLLTDNGAQQALDSLSGVQHAVTPQINNKLMQRFLQLVRHRSGQESEGNGLNSGDDVTKDRHWWMQGFAGDGEIDRDGSIAGMDYRNNGLALGFDMSLTQQWTLGLAGSIANSDINGGASDADVDSVQLAIYANWQQNDWYADLATAYAKHDTDSSRRVTVGLLTDIANSNYDSDTFGTSLEVGKHFHLQNELNLAPFVGLEYSSTDRDGFTETGSFANLTVNSEEYESIRSKLGLRLSKVFTSDKGTVYIPTARIAYVHESGDANNVMNAGLSAVPTTTFTVEGNEQDRDRMQLGLGLTANITDSTQISVDYDGEFAANDDYHSLSATLRVKW